MELMLTEFIDFVDSVLPSVDPDAKDKAKASITQFYNKEKILFFLAPKILPTLSQGDIISDIKFSYFDEDGKQKIFAAKGLVISTSCNIDNKDCINIVPVLPIEYYPMDDSKIRELKENKIFDFMYIPEGEMEKYFIDFSKVGTYDKNLIQRGIAEGNINRLFSLNQIGLYLLILKLTVFLMRKEDCETLEARI